MEPFSESVHAWLEAFRASQARRAPCGSSRPSSPPARRLRARGAGRRARRGRVLVVLGRAARPAGPRRRRRLRGARADAPRAAALLLYRRSRARRGTLSDGTRPRTARPSWTGKAAGSGSTTSRWRSCAARSCCSTSGRWRASTASASSRSCAGSSGASPTRSWWSACTRRSSPTSTTTRAVRAAVARHRIEHPVLDDPAMTTWDAYAVEAWPTLVLIDADGRVALTVSGEGHARRAGARRSRRSSPRPSAQRHAAPRAAARSTTRAGPAQGTGELAYPGKVAIEDGATRAPRVAIADTGHDRVLVCGAQRRGRDRARRALPAPGRALRRRRRHRSLLVCETGADRVWRIPLDGRGAELVTDRLKSPWDVLVWHGHTIIAEAGRHRLWALDRAGELQVVAGTGAEALRRRARAGGLLAQPSALALTADGDLAFLDAEASALRVVRAADVRGRDARGRRAVRLGRRRRRRRARAAAAPARPRARPRRRALHRRHLQRPHPRLARRAPVDGPGRGLRRARRDRRPARRPPARRRHRQPPHRARRPAARAARWRSTSAAQRRATRPPASPRRSPGRSCSRRARRLRVALDLDPGDDDLDPAGGPPVRVARSPTSRACCASRRRWTAAALPGAVDLALGTGSGRVDRRAAGRDLRPGRLPPAPHAARLRRPSNPSRGVDPCPSCPRSRSPRAGSTRALRGATIESTLAPGHQRAEDVRPAAARARRAARSTGVRRHRQAPRRRRLRRPARARAPDVRRAACSSTTSARRCATAPRGCWSASTTAASCACASSAPSSARGSRC